ncbi:MAG: ATP-binding protein, partial [Candidatus Sericytochromatia bacterium]
DLVIFLLPNNIKRDLLFISIKRRPSQNFISFEQIVLISIIIGLLLIPFSIYLLSPYKKIIGSINSIAQGNFDSKLFVTKNNEFKELYDAFNNMSNRINEMIKQKQRLIADVSHELRSPLTRMRMSQEILIDNPNVDKDKYLNETIQEIEHLDKTITDLLILSKFELDQNELKLERTNLKDFLLELLDKNDLIFENHQIKLNLNLQDNIFSKIDYKLIESAFNNIFSNLIRYSPFNSYVDINLLLINNEVSISIRDRGVGVKKSELEQIFEPFYRTDESRNSETGGTGLGLAILKKIIKAHGGKVSASLPIDQEGGLIINIVLKPEK